MSTLEIRYFRMVCSMHITVSHIESDEEIDVSNRTATWSCKRKKDFDYALPVEKYSTIYEEKLDVRGTAKRKVIALSDLHLGGSWSNGMDWKLDQYLDGVIETAKVEVS